MTRLAYEFPEVGVKARIYTKTGDKGETSLVDGTRVSKGSARLETYGTIDELNSVIGLIQAHLGQLDDVALAARVEERVQMIQNSLFNMGSRLACDNEKMRGSLPDLGATASPNLETDMDLWESEVPPLREFILPGGSVLAAFGHQARTVCRRAERELIRLRDAGVTVEMTHVVFLNRLSDWLFLFSRRVNAAAGVKDVVWVKG